MKTQGLDVFHDGDFEQFLAEDHDETTLNKDTDEALGTYCRMFRGPFFNIENTSISVSDEELYRWVSWCHSRTGRPRPAQTTLMTLMTLTTFCWPILHRFLKKPRRTKTPTYSITSPLSVNLP